MKRSGVGAVLVALCLAGCGSAGTGDVPRDEAPTSETTGGRSGNPLPEPSPDNPPPQPPPNDPQPAPDDPPPQPPPDDPPGVPGGPVTYDSTYLIGADALEVRKTIRQQLADLCGEGSCGIDVEVVGGRECTAGIGPNPAPRGGTVTITTKPCHRPEETTDETTTETTGDTTGETTDEPVPTT